MRFFKKIFLCMLILGMTVLLPSCTSGEDSGTLLLSEQQEDRQPETGASSEGSVYVYVCGEVKNPGVYEMDAGSRICDAVDRAGGFTKAAVRDSLNLAEGLSDGQMIRIPSKKELREQETQAGSQAADPGTDASAQNADMSGRVNLNTADAQTLMRLNGIGEAKARQIIAWREENGSFAKPEDLMKVPGIKEGTYEKLKDQVTV